MELRHTIRILNMPKNEAQMAAILRANGMQVYDDLRGIPPSDLTWQDDINGAGARTFIWNDRQVERTPPAPWTPERSRANYTSLPERRGLPIQSSFEEEVDRSDYLLILQRLYETGTISHNELRSQVRRVLDEQDVEAARDLIRSRAVPVTFPIASSSSTLHSSSFSYIPWISRSSPGFANGGFIETSNNSTEPPKIEIHEKQPARLVRLDD